jgi:hypothetical protein
LPQPSSGAPIVTSVVKTGANELTWTFSQVYSAFTNFDGLEDDASALDFAGGSPGTNQVVMTYVDPVNVGDGWTVNAANVGATWSSGLPLGGSTGTVT